MGVYSNNRSNSIGNIQVEAAEGYCGEVGLQLAMIEGYENDLAIFDGQIAKDFKEAGMVLENATAEDLYPVQESAIGDFLERIKQFFLKLWEKIKGIFRGFMAKLDSHLMKDSKAFHDKYKKEVYDKDLSKMKIKYSEPNDSVLKGFEFNITSGAPETNKVCLKVDTILSRDPAKLSEDFERDEFITGVLKGCKPSIDADPKDYAKDFHEACFKDEDEVDNASTILTEVATVLISKNPVEAVRKANTSIEKAIADIIKDIERSKSAVVKVMPKDFSGDVKTDYKLDNSGDKTKATATSTHVSTTGGAANVQKALNYMHTQATAIQSAVGMFTGCTLKETKFYVAQARRVYAAMVSYNPKSVKESALLVEAAQEAAEYEVMSALESM